MNNPKHIQEILISPSNVQNEKLEKLSKEIDLKTRVADKLKIIFI
jgi:hypothetical protein